MFIFEDLNQWKQHRLALSSAHVGFVPTMGNLHLGHLSLIERAKRENDYTVVSLFINPTQFNNPEDFNYYPRTLEADSALLKKANVDVCLLPSQHQIYADNFHYKIQENHLSRFMEGKHRPGHFEGVLTVVMKLLNLVKPNAAYFGEKDYQQYALIHSMATSFFMDCSIELCPTIRDEAGLAYSSRNNRLSVEEFVLAQRFASLFHQDKPCELLIHEMTQAGIHVEYLEEHEKRRYAAVLIGKIRLIDNYAV